MRTLIQKCGGRGFDPRVRLYFIKLDRMKEYKNSELARDYLGVAMQLTSNTPASGRVFDRRYDLIAKSPVNISELYAREGSLRQLKLKIGNPAKRILESILENGFEEAKRLVFEQRHEKVKTQQWPGAYRGPGSVDNDPSWDNAVRVREG